MNGRSDLVEVPAASREEAAAVVAALEMFRWNAAPIVLATHVPMLAEWKRTALIEGASRFQMLLRARSGIGR